MACYTLIITGQYKLLYKQPGFFSLLILVDESGLFINILGSDKRCLFFSKSTKRYNDML